MKKIIIVFLFLLSVSLVIGINYNYSTQFYKIAQDSSEVINTFLINNTYYPPLTKEGGAIVKTMNEVECNLATFADHRRMKYYFTWDLACKTLNMTGYDCWSCEGY